MSAEVKNSDCAQGDVDEDFFSDDSDDGDVITASSEHTGNQVTCIFTEGIHPSPEDYYLHLKTVYDFDIWQIGLSDLRLNFFGYVRLINYLRTEYRSKLPPTSKELENCRSVWENDDVYLKPVLEDDPLLQFMLNEDSSDESNEEYDYGEDEENSVLHDQLRASLLKERRMKKENKNLSQQLQEANAQILQMKKFMQDVILTGDGMYRPLSSCRQNMERYEDEEFEDSGYFGTYSHHDIHGEMLQDKVRTDAYRDTITKNSDAFRGKIVLDVGCGTGILSMLAAQAGASHVYGVDMSEIAYEAIDIVMENRLSDKVTILKGRIESIELPVSKVDIIISEWMGYFLFYESMLDSVLYARDKWLSPEGAIYPNKCSVSLIAIHDHELLQSRVNFWENVYGYKMSCIKEQVLGEGLIQAVKSGSIISEPVIVHSIDVSSMEQKNIDYKFSFSLPITKTGLCSAIVGYFDIFFDQNLKNKVMFTTSPMGQTTHWKQTVFFLRESLSVEQGNVLSCEIDCHKNMKDPRSLVVVLKVNDIKQTYKID